jgi:hypothetical protein
VSWVRLIAALGALLAAAGVGTAENSFMRGDYIAFLVTEFRSVETAPDKSYSMIRGVTITGREFSIEARWGGLKSCPDFRDQSLYFAGHRISILGWFDSGRLRHPTA